MNAYQNGYTSTQLQDDKCTISQSTGGWAWAVGAEVLVDDAVWKLHVNRMGNVMMGVVANAAPSNNYAHGDSTFVAWYQANNFYAPSGTTQGSQGWPGWQQGDEAIFALNASARTLTVHLKRTRQNYTAINLPAGKEGQWRVAVDMNSTTAVVLSQPTDEEVALVK